MAKLLVVDDDPTILKMLTELLGGRAGYEVTAVVDSRKAREMLGSRATIDLLVTDLRMDSVSGLDLIEYSREKRPGMPVVVISAYLDDAMVEAVRILGCSAYVRKPFHVDEVVTAIQIALGLRQPPEAT